MDKVSLPRMGTSHKEAHSGSFWGYNPVYDDLIQPRVG